MLLLLCPNPNRKFNATLAFTFFSFSSFKKLKFCRFIYSGAGATKLFTVLFNVAVLCSIAFVTVYLFHPSLIFAGKARSLPLDWITVSGSTRVGSRGLYYKTFYGRNLLISVVFVLECLSLQAFPA
jgi:hypothetical protein